MTERTNIRPIAGAVAGWSEHGHGNLSQRLATALRRQIEAGLIVSGSRLPPERQLAADLAVSRSTVTAALDILRAEQLVVSRQGHGTVVVSDEGSGIAANRIADHLVVGSGGIDLAVGNPADASHLPAVSIDVADLIASGAGPGFQPLGLPSMRSALAEMHSLRGLHTSADEIQVTAGAHHAIAVLLGAYLVPGDVVAAEVPGYPGLFDVTDGLGVRVAPVELDRGGMRPESLDAALTEHRPRFAYVQAGVHNPTGRVTSAARLRALAAIFDRHETTVIEDTTLSELVFAGRPSVDLASLCRRAPVVTVGSWSKVFWGGLRVGWIRAPEAVIERTLHRRLAADLGAAIPSQLFCLRLMPHLDEIAEQRRRFLENNVGRAAGLLADEVPEWRFEMPSGASVLWVDTGLDDAAPLEHFAHRHGVHVASGSIAAPGPDVDGHLRLCVDRPWELVDAGLRRLGAAWRELSRRPARVAG